MQLSCFGFAQQADHSQRLGLPRGQQLSQVVEGNPGIDNILDKDHVLALDRLVDVFPNLDHTRRRLRTSVAADLNEIELALALKSTSKIGQEVDRALEHAHQQNRLSTQGFVNLGSERTHRVLDLFGRKHDLKAVWHRREFSFLARPVAKIALTPMLGLLLTVGLLAGQSMPKDKIVVGITPDMFPDFWREPPLSARATAPDPRNVPLATQSIREALSLYPAQVIQNRLQFVHILGKLVSEGQPFGATNSRDRIYITTGSIQAGYTRDFYHRALHHEFSSILIREANSPEFWRQWRSCNPSGTGYLSDGVAAIAGGVDNTNPAPALWSKGFFTQYSQASEEEDFNMIVENLFDGEARLWKAAKKSAPIQNKVNLTIQFYKSVDPKFTTDWFRKRVR